MSRQGRKSELEATQQTIKFFETLLRASADGIVITDTSQNIVLVNEAFCAFFGQRWLDVIETNLFIWLEQLDDDGPQCWAELERCIHLEKVYRDVEFRLVTEDGPRYLSVNCALLDRVADEETGVIISIWRDVTGRKQAEEALQKAHDELEMRVTERTSELAKANEELRVEIVERKRVQEALRESEETARVLLNAPTDTLLLIDAEGYIVALNETAAERLGRCADDLVGMCAFDLLLPDVAEYRRIQSNKAIRSGKPVRFEDEREGRWFEQSVYPVFDTQGEVRHLAVFARDITERKQAEDALRESEERYRGVVQDTPVLICRFLPDGEIIFVNRTYCEYFARTPEELVGSPFLSLIPESDRETVMANISALTVESPMQSHEHQVIVHDGDTRWQRWNNRALFDARGKVVAYQSIGVDITERVQAEEKIRKLNVKLEQRVIERTAQLQTANRDLQAFTYSVSHDLRAPLRAIHGFSDIIARRHRASLNEEGQHYFDNIVQASGQMDLLINDLLTYSRLGRRSVRRQPVALGDLLAGVIEILAGRIAETGAQLDIPGDLPTINSDQTLLSQIFTNLLDNAITYHRPGVAPSVEVQAHPEADHIILHVADNGIGIPPEFHEKIFNIFQRLHGQDDYPGTGIGLAVVKKSVALLEGQVWVESVVGEGSVFCVKLPRT